MSNVLHANFRRNQVNASRAQVTAIDRGIRLPTTEMKLHIQILELVLSIPSEHEQGVKSDRVRKIMSDRLALYRRELALRDAARDEGQQLTEQALSQGISALQRKHKRVA